MTPPPLPRSLDPLPRESLPGYLLRLAHRLGLSPAQVAVRTGIASTARTVPVTRMLALDPATADTFARATRLTADEVTALTLTSLADRYPPLRTVYAGRHRTTNGLFVKENWVFSQSTRYCPDCLYGDDSTIQQRHGGAWNILWRLPITIACPTHHRLLDHTCPACRTPVHHRTATTLLPNLSHPGLHPAACRNTRDHTGRTQPCGHRLDIPRRIRPAVEDDELHHLLRLAHHLLGLLDPADPTAVTSVGQPTTPDRYLTDLRILTCLIAATWPATRHLATHPAQTRRLTRHARHTRRLIAQQRQSGHAVRELFFYDKPPLDSATGAGLLAIAHAITTADPDTASTILRPLITSVPSAPIWLRRFLTDHGHCSPGLEAVLHPLAHPPAPAHGSRVPSARPVRFGVEHVPQYLEQGWYDQHLAHITRVTPRLLRRAAATRLAQISLGGTVEHAALRLGLPPRAARHALDTIGRQLDTRIRRALFTAAIDALTDLLNTDTDLIDYGRRRTALSSWQISPEQWQAMIADIARHAQLDRRAAHSHWGNGKRILASIWVWTRITCGEHLYAPPLRPDPAQPRTGNHGYIHHRWPFLTSAKTGHYAALRDILAPYEAEVAERVSRDQHGSK